MTPGVGLFGAAYREPHRKRRWKCVFS